MPYGNYKKRPMLRRDSRSVYHSGSTKTRPKRGAKKEQIHHSKFIKKAANIARAEYVATHTFADFDVASILHRNIVKKGFVTPSAIQDQAIPLGLTGVDIIGIADTGTGKTVAFGIPVLNQLLKNPASTALIMAPTRELAEQIEAELRSLYWGSGMWSATLIGGAAMGPQLKALSRSPSVVIGTPGRIKDHIERGTLKTDMFDIVVLDEVDRMLDMGFVNDMRKILGMLKTERQSFFFSATMDAKVRSLINEFSHDPVTISVKTGDTSENVDQDVVFISEGEQKIEKLHEILSDDNASKVLVFDDTKWGVEKLSKNLITRGFKAASIHGGKNQSQRRRALDGFKQGHTTILVATDVAARGIDVSDVTHVINYSTPSSYADYVHRIGRAGRAGKTGKAFTFVEK